MTLVVFVSHIHMQRQKGYSRGFNSFISDECEGWFLNPFVFYSRHHVLKLILHLTISGNYFSNRFRYIIRIYTYTVHVCRYIIHTPRESKCNKT